MDGVWKLEVEKVSVPEDLDILKIYPEDLRMDLEVELPPKIELEKQPNERSNILINLRLYY
jgi:hypothetical protein